MGGENASYCEVGVPLSQEKKINIHLLRDLED